MNLLMNLGITFVVLLGAYRVMGRKTDPGVIIAFTQYFTMISTATLSITRIFMMYTRSTASAARIQQVVDAPRELTALSEADYPIKEENGYIVFENVSFPTEERAITSKTSLFLCRGVRRWALSEEREAEKRRSSTF